MVERETSKRSLFKLIGDLPGNLIDLIKSELEQLKQEIAEKVKHAGIGVGLLAGAATFAFFAFSVLIAAAVLGIATALPAWAAALIVGGALLLITGILALLGIRQLKQGVPPTPTDTIESVKKDVETVRGIGNNDIHDIGKRV